MSYIENALNLARSPPESAPRAFGTQAEFLQALRIMGTSFPEHTRQLDPRNQKRMDMQAVFLSCSRESWEWVFGPPRNVTEHRSSHSSHAFQTWECLCADGMVVCLGHISHTLQNVPRIVLARIFLFECGDRVTWSRSILFWLEGQPDVVIDTD